MQFLFGRNVGLVVGCALEGRVGPCVVRTVGTVVEEKVSVFTGGSTFFSTASVFSSVFLATSFEQTVIIE